MPRPPRIHRIALRLSLAAALVSVSLAGGLVASCRSPRNNDHDAGASLDAGDGGTQFQFPATVTRVVDGDTIEVDFYGFALTVRFFCVDTPELGPPDPYAFEARQYTIDHASPTLTVGLEFDNPMCGTPPVPSSCYDGFGRLLAYVRTPGGLDLNRELVANGLAQVYTQANCGREADYLDAQTSAQNQSLGIWGP